MRVQIDRCEDGGWAVLLLYPDGKRSFDAPHELLPAGASPRDVFVLSFEHAREETDCLAGENERLLGQLLRGEEG